MHFESRGWKAVVFFYLPWFVGVGFLLSKMFNLVFGE